MWLVYVDTDAEFRFKLFVLMKQAGGHCRNTDTHKLHPLPWCKYWLLLPKQEKLIKWLISAVSLLFSMFLLVILYFQILMQKKASVCMIICLCVGLLCFLVLVLSLFSFFPTSEFSRHNQVNVNRPQKCISVLMAN